MMDHLEWLAHDCDDDQELAGIRDVTETWLANHYLGLTEAQRLAMTRAIFEEAITDMRRAIHDIVESVLERYGFVPPSRRADSAPRRVLQNGRETSLA